MNQLLNEFISYILPERTVRAAGKSWSTNRGWYAKSPSGGRSRFFGNTKTSRQRARLFASGQSTTPTGITAPETKQRRRAAEPVPAQRGGKSDAEVPQKKEVPMSAAPGSIPAKPLKPAAALRDKQILDNTESSMESRGFDSNDDRKRFYVFTDLWRAFIGAPTYEEQVKAVSALADKNFIQRSPNGKKIYVTPITGLTPKHMCSTSGADTSVTRLMNAIIEREGIVVPLRGGSADRALAAVSGTHNEAGVTRYLFESPENLQRYEALTQRYQSLGGDIVAADERNKTGADVVRAFLPKKAKITNATEVGSVGAKRLRELGIDPKADPTDILVEYIDANKRYIMKISAKIYTDPRNITMKNSGVKKAGVYYLGEKEGQSVDEEWKKLWKKYKWDMNMSEEERVVRKSALRQAYLKLFASKMEKLAKTDDGQKQLLKMWKEVHGCGKGVHTLVINKKTNQSELRGPSYYCNPKVPFKVRYDGTSVVIEMRTGGPQTLQIGLKTEDKSSPKLMFRHIIRGKG